VAPPATPARADGRHARERDARRSPRRDGTPAMPARAAEGARYASSGTCDHQAVPAPPAMPPTETWRPRPPRRDGPPTAPALANVAPGLPRRDGASTRAPAPPATALGAPAHPARAPEVLHAPGPPVTLTFADDGGPGPSGPLPCARRWARRNGSARWNQEPSAPHRRGLRPQSRAREHVDAPRRGSILSSLWWRRRISIPFRASILFRAPSDGAPLRLVSRASRARPVRWSQKPGQSTPGISRQGTASC
jgi:hypothetical protein